MVPTKRKVRKGNLPLDVRCTAHEVREFTLRRVTEDVLHRVVREGKGVACVRRIHGYLHTGVAGGGNMALFCGMRERRTGFNGLREYCSI